MTFMGVIVVFSRQENLVNNKDIDFIIEPLIRRSKTCFVTG